MDRVRNLSSEEFREHLKKKTIRPASLEDVHGTHHKRPLVKHPNTGQWYVFTKDTKMSDFKEEFRLKNFTVHLKDKKSGEIHKVPVKAKNDTQALNMAYLIKNDNSVRHVKTVQEDEDLNELSSMTVRRYRDKVGYQRHMKWYENDHTKKQRDKSLELADKKLENTAKVPSKGRPGKWLDRERGKVQENESAVPVNSMGTGAAIATFDPILRAKKKKLRDVIRRKPPLK